MTKPVMFERKDLGRVVTLEIDPSFDEDLAKVARVFKAESITTEGRILEIRKDGVFIESIDGQYAGGKKIQYEVPYTSIKREVQ